ncbi:MAG TPA: DUF2188 domain-containing protein [Devosiaceae bacterium]|jgi:hypothetical protein|nr:DUF2188 domain-containing protein [Devosiaceae bacterium]
MVQVKYQVVEHNGGWAYKVNDVFSETFPTHQEAHAAAEAAAERQQLAGRTGVIEYEDPSYKWHQEISDAGDRPETSVEDDLADPAPTSDTDAAR